MRSEQMFGFRRCFKILKKRIVPIILWSILFVIVTNFISICFVNKVYQAVTVLKVVSKNENAKNEVASQVPKKDYGDLVKQGAILSRALEELKIVDLSYEILSTAISVNFNNDTKTLEIKVKDILPTRVILLSNKIAEVFASKFSETDSLENIVIVNPAVSDFMPVAPNVILNDFIALVIGLVLVLIGVLVLEHFNVISESDNIFETNKQNKVHAILNKILILDFIKRFDTHGETHGVKKKRKSPALKILYKLIKYRKLVVYFIMGVLFLITLITAFKSNNPYPVLEGPVNNKLTASLSDSILPTNSVLVTSSVLPMNSVFTQVSSSVSASLPLNISNTPLQLTPTTAVLSGSEGKKMFKDVSEGFWAKDYIEKLAAKNIVSGVYTGLFIPEENVTRAQFSAFLVKALGIALGKYSGKIKDVGASMWFTPFVEAAVGNGIVTGNQFGEFKPDDNMNREQMAVMVMNAVRHSIGTDTKVYETNQSIVFKDFYTSSPWARDSVMRAAKMNIISGMYEGVFSPKEFTQRSQGAAVIYKMLTVLKKL